VTLRLAAGIIYEDANIKVTAIENTHFRFQPGTPPYGKYKSFSYRFDTLGRSFVFTGDTGWSDAVIDLAKGADVLVTEVTDTDDVIGLMKRNGAWQAKSESEQEGWLRHMHEEHVTPEEVGRLAAQAGVKTVVMTHLSPSSDPNDDFARYARCKEAFLRLGSDCEGFDEVLLSLSRSGAEAYAAHCRATFRDCATTRLTSYASYGTPTPLMAAVAQSAIAPTIENSFLGSLAKSLWRHGL
jgi:Beta-lactamase superfamily domain